MEKKIHLVFSLVMSVFMVAIMSFVVTLINIGWVDTLISQWLESFFYAWLVAFPIIYVFSPIFRKLVTKQLTKG